MQISFSVASTMSLLSAPVACHTAEDVAESAKGDEDLTASGNSGVGGAAGVVLSASQSAEDFTEPSLIASLSQTDLCTAVSVAGYVAEEEQDAVHVESFGMPPAVTNNEHESPTESPLPAAHIIAADASGSTASPPPSPCAEPVQEQNTAAISPPVAEYTEMEQLLRRFCIKYGTESRKIPRVKAHTMLAERMQIRYVGDLISFANIKWALHRLKNGTPYPGELILLHRLRIELITMLT